MNNTGFYSTLPAQSDEMCFDIFEDEIFSSLTKDEKMCLLCMPTHDFMTKE